MTKIDVRLEDETVWLTFKKVQNKIHFAVHGETAAEVIYHKVDAEKEFMVQVCQFT